MAAPTHALIAEIAPYSKSGAARLNAMGKALWRIDEYGIAGDIVECGVWRGGNIILARRLCPTRVCWLYDTFDGMTEPQEVDRKKSGFKAATSYHAKLANGQKWAAVSRDQVRANLAATKTLDDRWLRFVKGPVEQTLVDPTNLPSAIALLRLDTDWYASTKAELEALYPLLTPGGYLIVDDYGHWEGAKKAVDDYFHAKGLLPMQSIDYSAVLIQKPC
jgi:O-methyltransferase